MLDANVDYLSEALRVKKVKYESRGIKSVHSRVTCINDHLEQKLTMEEFKKKLRDAVLSREDVQPLTLREEDYRGIRKSGTNSLLPGNGIMEIHLPMPL